MDRQPGGNAAAINGGGGSGGTWATTTSSVSGELINHPNNNSDVVVIGATGTTTANYYIDPNINFAFFKYAILSAICPIRARACAMYGPIEPVASMTKATSIRGAAESAAGGYGCESAAVPTNRVPMKATDKCANTSHSGRGCCRQW